MPNCSAGLLLLFSAIAFFAVAVVLFVNAANTYERQMAKNVNKQIHEKESLTVFFWAIMFTYASGALFASSIFVMYRGTFLRFSQALAESSDESSDDKEHED